MRHGLRSRLPAMLLGVLAAGCGDSPTGGNPGDQARVTVRLTDAPGDFKAAVVTISEINLQGNGKVVLSSEPVTTDLS